MGRALRTVGSVLRDLLVGDDPVLAAGVVVLVAAAALLSSWWPLPVGAALLLCWSVLRVSRSGTR